MEHLDFLPILKLAFAYSFRPCRVFLIFVLCFHDENGAVDAGLVFSHRSDICVSFQLVVVGDEGANGSLASTLFWLDLKVYLQFVHFGTFGNFTVDVLSAQNCLISPESPIVGWNECVLSQINCYSFDVDLPVAIVAD